MSIEDIMRAAPVILVLVLDSEMDWARGCNYARCGVAVTAWETDPSTIAERARCAAALASSTSH